jgi:hypothetical protein
MIGSGKNMPVVTAEALEKAKKRLIKKQGRPTKFNVPLAADILARLESGDTLADICRLPGYPSRGMVYDWGNGVPAFGDALARARKVGGGAMAENGVKLLQDAGGAGSSMITVRLAEMRAKYNLELAKCYDRETYGQNIKLEQSVTVETMDQRLARLTGGIVTIPAEFSHLID